MITAAKMHGSAERVPAAGLRATLGAWFSQQDMGFLVICVIIFLGSLVAGAVPFFLNLGERHVNLLSGFGAGMLVSTALAVILPEGVEAFHHAGEELGEPSHPTPSPYSLRHATPQSM